MRKGFTIIRNLCAELYRVKTGKKRAAKKDVKKILLYYTRLFGFDDVSWLTQENIWGLERILKAQIERERKKRCLPTLY